jgi:cell fate regulator YaaT (PSP1 superfamily)
MRGAADPHLLRAQRSPYIGSAPATDTRRRRRAAPTESFYTVSFNRYRAAVLRGGADYDDGDWVIVEADRGIDMGQIIARAEAPKETPPAIIRRATQREIDAVPAKEAREQDAMLLCQARVAQMGLPMDVTGAEIQFDAKKVTFYYSATKYVDFRDLVRSLFRHFGTRIWMVWRDEEGPIRDVITRRGRDVPTHPFDA